MRALVGYLKMIYKRFKLVFDIIGIVLGIVLFVFLYKGGKALYNKFFSNEKGSDSDIDNAKSDLEKMQSRGFKPSRSPSFYSDLAEGIYQSGRKKTIFGNHDEAEIKEWLHQCKSYADLLALKTAFGKRSFLGFEYDLTSFVSSAYNKLANIYYNTYFRTMYDNAKKYGHIK